MIADPTVFFSAELAEGRKLCLLPMSRMHAEEPVWLARELLFYPANTLSSAPLRVAWEPKRELEEFFAKNHAVHPEFATAEGTELHWIKSAATEVTVEDLITGGLLAFPIDLDWDSFLAPASHEAHLHLISYAAAHAEKYMNQIRFDNCRINTPEILPERAGLLENKQFSAALFYTQQDNESYIIAGDLVRQRFVTGLGLEICGAVVRTFPSGEVWHITSHALQMHTDALEAPNDTAKFINLINLLDYLAAPSDYLPMAKAKAKIARHVAKTRSEYDAIIEDFKFLTSAKDEDNQNFGLRHNIIHIGKRLEDMLIATERKEVLARMDGYARKVIEDLFKLSGQTWSDVEAMRSSKGNTLGL